MLKITRFTCENLQDGCVTDVRHPNFSYTLESDRDNTFIRRAKLTINNWSVETDQQIAIPYKGFPLRPFTEYEAKIVVYDCHGEQAEGSLVFETGRLDTPWTAQWISDATYLFTEKKVSPKPMTFVRRFTSGKTVASAKIYATALGIYELEFNGEKVGNQYFAPGFTSYESHLQYQVYDVTNLMKQENTLTAVVGGGWAVGSFVFTRKNRISGDRQALLLELRIVYHDQTVEVISTDTSWDVTEDGNYRMADFYDGETFDAAVALSTAAWKKAAVEKLRIHPQIRAAYGAPVIAHEELEPVSVRSVAGQLIYDFGQNFAGVVSLEIQGTAGQEIVVKHAEVLQSDGTLNTTFLRSARACATYICKEGRQRYSPKMTYMGFRYISVTGIQEADIKVSALVLYSDLETNGWFSCSNDQLNRLQQNILWSSRSNFMDIPTDCPQRDERMGWTGDIAVFSSTACYNFNMSRFLEKWLGDMRAEQLSTGGIPNTVPAQGYGFPATMPTMAMDFWGDACVLVPWAEYQARGDVRILRACYPMMKKYVKACRFWAGLFGVGKHRYIWNTPSVLHFGDWVAPDVLKMSQWQARSKWTATASLKNTSTLLARIAEILGEKQDADKYRMLSERVAEAYRAVFTDGNGKLKEEFQTAYVLPLHFKIFQGKEKENAAKNLAELVKKAGYCIGTGFPGTPYILFALADNGHVDTAYQMLLNQKCPSWLYEVKMGATTIWERWDGLDENEVCPIGDDGTDQMISYNHYASGAVGDFLYRRIAGIEPTAAGYQRFQVKPCLGGDLKHAEGRVFTPYGWAGSKWELADDCFSIQVEVPVGTLCKLVLPDGSTHELTNGVYSYKTTWKKENCQNEKN